MRTTPAPGGPLLSSGIGNAVAQKVRAAERLAVIQQHPPVGHIYSGRSILRRNRLDRTAW